MRKEEKRKIKEKDRGIVDFIRLQQHFWKDLNIWINIQKNIRYDIQHANSKNYNAMKCHYLLTQIADILLQLYEKSSPGLREIKKEIKKMSSDLLAGFAQQLTGEDIFFIETYGYIKTVV